MTEPRSDKLIRELFALCARYSRGDFQDALAALESGQAIEPLLRTLNRAMAAAPRTHIGSRPRSARKSKSPKERLDQFVEELSRRPDEDSTSIAKFITDITERRLLRNAPQLKEYMRRLNLPDDAKTDRRIFARRIGEALLNVPPTRRRELIAMAANLGVERSSLQAWSDVIVKDNR